jgi:iron complex transport system permease protein
MGRRMVTLQTAQISRRLGLRATLVTVGVAVTALIVGVIALTLGETVISVPDVVGALVGVGDQRAQLVVNEWRLPRVLAALLLGGALGISGAIFQSLTRNPLGSPDVIGFDAGAYTGALVVFTTMTSGALQVAVGSLAGGLTTALLVYLLAFRRGFHGFRLIIVGIGIASMLASLNVWITLNADLDVAVLASAWGAGSLNAITADQVQMAAVILLPLAVAAAVLADRMHLLELGDDSAAALGMRITPVRILLVIVGVGLTATVISVAGPIAFVALAAPQIARRLTHSAGVTLTASAAVGALGLVASDVAAQRMFAPTQLPVGLLTVCLGGVYLIWLLIQEARSR